MSGRKSAGCWATIGDAVAAQLLDRVGEAGGALLGDRDAGQALDLHHVALAVELLGEVVGGRDADAVVVAADPGPVGALGGELAVDVDHRDALLHGLEGHRGQRAALVGQDDQRVGVLGDELLDLRHLGRRVVGALEQDELDVVVARRPPPRRCR